MFCLAEVIVPVPRNPVTEYGFGIGGAVLFILLIIVVLKIFLRFLADQRIADQARTEEERKERTQTREDFLNTYRNMAEAHSQSMAKIARETSAALAKNTETLDRLCRQVDRCPTQKSKKEDK